jgi:lipoprotein-anchoring transpeptidase ErfK/SrfK
MHRLWVIAVAGLALAGFTAASAEAAIVKANYSVQQDKPLEKLQPKRKAARAPVCQNFFQCLFGGARRSDRMSSYGGGGFDRVTRTTVSFNDGKYRPGSIIIRTPERALYYVLPGGKALRYRVGVGREGFQWGGRSHIVMKREWPEWRPPKVMIERERAKGHIIPEYMEGGPENPLGARAMYIGGTMFRIHGTNNAASIGGAVSSGCIRMMNADVIDLYGRVAVGSPVYVYQ